MRLRWLLWGVLPFLLGTTWTWDAVTTDSEGNATVIAAYTFAVSSDHGATFATLACTEQDNDPTLLGRRCTPSDPPPEGACFHVTATNTAGTSGPSNVAGGCAVPRFHSHRH